MPKDRARHGPRLREPIVEHDPTAECTVDSRREHEATANRSPNGEVGADWSHTRSSIGCEGEDKFLYRGSSSLEPGRGARARPASCRVGCGTGGVPPVPVASARFGRQNRVHGNVPCPEAGIAVEFSGPGRAKARVGAAGAV